MPARKRFSAKMCFFIGVRKETRPERDRDGPAQPLSTVDRGRTHLQINSEMRAWIRDAARRLGFELCGIAPAELEALLLEHPAVMDSAVIPKRDDECGEIPKAFVLLHQGQDASPEDLMRFVEERVAPYKKVREIEFVDAIPKTPSGKILRRELIEQERAKSS